MRIRLVFYIPDLRCRLLSIETLLMPGYTCIGDKLSIKVVKGSKTFLTFYPRSEKDSIYVMKSGVTKEKDIFVALNTIYGIGFDTQTSSAPVKESAAQG